MRFWIIGLLCSALISAALPALALAPGTDILVPAAGRGGGWITDLYIMNPGTETATVTVAWLVRDQANNSPDTQTFTAGPGETLVLADVIDTDFGLSEANGAFRVTADFPVVVNSRIYSLSGLETFGQGFEGVPTSLATTSGQSGNVVGLSVNSGFRTNFYACAGADGVVMDLTLLEPDGATVIATRRKTLEAWMPFLKKIDDFMGSGDFDQGTLQVEITTGSAVVGASKVDLLSGDPTTLESSVATMAADVNGTYQFAIYDSLSYSTGGNLSVESGELTSFNGTYTNWDKLDGTGDSACKWILLFGDGISLPTTLDDLAEGVTFSDDYSAHGLGIMTWALEIEFQEGLYFTGTLDAVGADFPTDVDGCNGDFPQLTVYGGKLPTP
ncbi:MAG: hypothetical protein K8R59_07395 [Thermoanaerobaculales bacterium]|nr:hypothetical protein [Thermoanaerobaculales bacterium]